MTKTVLCADIGTSSLKAALIDSQGNVLALSRQASKDWLLSLVDACRELHALCPESNIDALCISGNGPTLVSSDGTVLLWNVPVPKDIKVVGPSLFIPRLLTFRYLYPAIFAKSDTIFSGPEYLIYQLTGTKITILPEDRFITAYWDEISLAQNDFSTKESDKLPPFVKPGFCAGSVSEDLAKLMDISTDTKVYCGAPDFVSALVGSGTLKSGMICDRAGSSEGINLCTNIPLRADGIRTLPSVIPGLWNASVLLPQSGIKFTNYIEELKQKTNTDYTYNQFIHDFIESTPDDASMYKGFILMNDIALNVKQALHTLRLAAEEAGLKMDYMMTITGGQSKSNQWTQYKANITGIDIAVPRCTDAELIGDAVFAFTGMGLYPDFITASETLCQKDLIYSPQNTI